MRRAKRRGDLIPELTPLIDVIFLLLIFFMVTSVFRKEEATLLLQLPKTDGHTIAKEVPKSLIIELSKSKLALNGKSHSFEDFAEFCKKLKDKQIPIDLRVDKTVVYDRLVKILNILQRNELSNLSLITDK